MGIRFDKEELNKKEKLEIPDELKDELLDDAYDLDSFGDSFIMMPKMDEELRDQTRIEQNIKKEWLEEFPKPDSEDKK